MKTETAGFCPVIQRVSTLRNWFTGEFVRLLDAFLTLPRSQRRFIALLIDSVACLMTGGIAFALRVGADSWIYSGKEILLLGMTALVIWVPLASWRGVYRNLIRFSGITALVQLMVTCVFLAVPLIVIFGLISVPGIPRTLSVIHPLVFFIYLMLSRIGLRFTANDLFRNIRSKDGQTRNVLIYGAGRGGRQLADSLRQESHLRLIGYLDDNSHLHGQRTNDVPIWHSSELDKIVGEHGIDEVILAIPSLRRAQRRDILARLQGRKLKVSMLPGVSQLLDGHVTVSDIRPVQIEDLLGRNSVAPDAALMEQSLSNKVVLVSGAGGSIGSELCRQIIRHRPRRLILVEQSELALYTVESELRGRIEEGELDIGLHAEMGDVADKDAMIRLFRRWSPQTVYHAAAYKHVPLVEANPIAGLRNNIFGTLHCALAAEMAGVERFILVSTDKAVRPTNVMGASKRVCELVLQGLAERSSKTIFSMVRFGNVLGSSGSVVPLFKAQIDAGGPITLTHRDVVRYFMTIPEAAQLVIQAGSMAQGGEVFVLDMGRPIKIHDLAEAMIRLSGLTIKNEANPDGDIQIVEIGLRPGEKLYEELLIGNHPAATRHKRIMQARETFETWHSLAKQLAILAEFLDAGNRESAVALLAALVPDYRQQNEGKAGSVLLTGGAAA